MKQSALRKFSSAPAGNNLPSAGAEAVQTLLFKDRIPEFAHSQWLALCRNSPWLETTLRQAVRAREVHTYAVREDGRTIALYFFLRQNHRVLVLNGEASVQGRALFRFAHYVFDHFPQIREIDFQASHRYICRPSRFGRKSKSTDRVVLPARPSTQMEEATQFSKRKVSYYLQRLEREFPSAHFDIHTDGAIDENVCRSILLLQRPRIATLGNDEPMLEDAQEKLIHAVKAAGMTCALTIDGTLAAGLICQRIGHELHLRFLAQDPRFQVYGLGMLCCYFATCAHLNRHRRKKGPSVQKPRYSHTLAVQQHSVTAICIRRPHASWLIRCDVAIYNTAMATAARYARFRDDCVQLGGALVRLASAWRLLFKAAKNWPARVICRGSLLPSFLRGH